MITPAEQRLLEAVSESRLVALCSRLVQTPTVSPYSGDRAPAGEAAGQALVEQEMAELGGAPQRVLCRDELFARAGVLAPSGRRADDRPNVIGTWHFGPGPVVLMEAHMDTVAVDRYEGDPFSGRIEAGFIHGRGASDDKQGVTIMLEAVRALRAAGVTPAGTLIACSVVDEECDGAGRGTLACLDHVGQLDAVVAIDGSYGLVCKGCTGVVTAEITVIGRAGHAALGHSVNAIEKAVALMPAFAAFRQVRGNRPGDLNLGVFQAGDHPGNVPNAARLGLNLKTYPEDMAAARQAYGHDDGRLVRELFERCVKEQAEQDDFLRQHPPVIRWVKDVPAVDQDEAAAPWCEAAAAALGEGGGERPVIDLLGGWGDLAHYLRAGIPTVGLGAGWPGAAHSAREQVSTAHMVATARGLVLLLHRLLSGAVPLPSR